MKEAKQATPSGPTPRGRKKIKPSVPVAETAKNGHSDPVEMKAPEVAVTSSEPPVSETLETVSASSELPPKEKKEKPPFAPQAPVVRNAVAPKSPVADYTLLTYFDKGAGQYVGTVAEYPELKLQGTRRSELVEEVELRLEDQFEIMRRRGEAIPDAVANRQYPEKLEVVVSRGLYRRLDWLSRMERVPLDKLVTELLSSSIERRYVEVNRPSGGERRQPSHQPQQHRHGSGGGHRQHHRHSGGGGHGDGNRNRNFNESIDKGDNFLEYVRNLEKGKWRK